MRTYWLALSLAAVGTAARAEAPVTTTGESFELGGYANLEFERMFQSTGRGDRNGSFDLTELDLVLNWHGSENLRVAADLGWNHGTDLSRSNADGSVVVNYAWAEYRFQDWLKVRAGKMFTPFGIYNEFHTAKTAILTVKEPRSTGSTTSLGGAVRAYPRYQTGVALLGNGDSRLGAWDYVATVSNGDTRDATQNPYEQDDNKYKAVTARVRLSPIPSLELGGSFYVDWINELDAVTKKPTGELTRLTSWGAQVTFRPGKVAGLELEYVGTGVDYSRASGKREVWSHGLSAMVFGAFSPKYVPYLRYEWLDPDAATAHDYGSIAVAGLAYRPHPTVLLKAEVDTFLFGDANGRRVNTSGPAYTDYSELKLAMAVGF